MKLFRIKFALKFIAILDLIFAERFELTTYKDGKQKSKTEFCRKEINGLGKN